VCITHRIGLVMSSSLTAQLANSLAARLPIAIRSASQLTAPLFWNCCPAADLQEARAR
jgi:hypothetical protein